MARDLITQVGVVFQASIGFLSCMCRSDGLFGVYTTFRHLCVGSGSIAFAIVKYFFPNLSSTSSGDLNFTVMLTKLTANGLNTAAPDRPHIHVILQFRNTTYNKENGTKC